MAVRSRHGQGATSRATHTQGGVDFASPTSGLYGSQMDIEAVTTLDLGAGAVQDGNIMPGGLDGNLVIRQGTLPPTSFDHTPPALPSGISVDSILTPDADGRQMVAIRVTLTQPPDDDFFATYIEVTRDSTGDPATPVWLQPIVSVLGVGLSTALITGIAGATPYWVRMRTSDVQGNYSTYSAEYPVTTVADTEAPGQPSGAMAAGGFRSVGVRWSPGTAADLMFNEVRVAPDDGTGLAPDTTHWTILRTRGNSIVIDDLDPGQYWVQVRSVDYSRNTVTSNLDSTAVNYLSNPEAGWADAVTATAALVGAADVAFNSVITNILAANQIDASTIGTGLLNISTAAGTADGIKVLSSGVVIGDWDDTGLKIRSTVAGRSTLDYLLLTGASLQLIQGGVPVSAITVDGINASAINFGAQAGGHNLVFNSSFELSQFIATSADILGAGGDTFAGGVGGWTLVANTNGTLAAGTITETAV